MERLYLQGPPDGGDASSLVQIAQDGSIGGFLGVLATRYVLEGETLSAGVIGSLMAAEGEDNVSAGAQLLRAVNSAAFDMLLTDSANRISLAFIRPMKYELMLFDSLQWIRIFKPTAMLVEQVRQRWPRPPVGMLKALAGFSDAVAARLFKTHPTSDRRRRWVAEQIDAETFASIAPGLATGYRLRPEWGAAEVRWLLARAAEKRALGPLHFARVVDLSGVTIGCYAYYGEPGRLATILHLFAVESAWGSVLDCVIASAEALGCCGLMGQGHRALMSHLYRYPRLIFRYAGGTSIRAARKDVIAAVRADDVLIGGLAGDRWTCLSADDFR